jgi:hypothetical protein
MDGNDVFLSLLLKRRLYAKIVGQMRRLNRAEKLLFVAPFCVIALSLGVHQWRIATEEAKRDAIERESRKLAGVSAVNCGRTRINRFTGDYDAETERAQSDFQAFAAYKKKQPFYVIHDEGEFGKSLTHQNAVILTPQNQLYFLTASTSRSGVRTVQKKLCATLSYAPLPSSVFPQLQCK